MPLDRPPLDRHKAEQYFVRQQSPMYSDYINNYDNYNDSQNQSLNAPPPMPTIPGPPNSACQIVGQCMPIEEAEKLTAWYSTLDTWYDQMRQWHSNLTAIAAIENNREMPQIIKVPTKCKPCRPIVKPIYVQQRPKTQPPTTRPTPRPLPPMPRPLPPTPRPLPPTTRKTPKKTPKKTIKKTLS